MKRRDFNKVATAAAVVVSGCGGGGGGGETVAAAPTPGLDDAAPARPPTTPEPELDRFPDAPGRDPTPPEAPAPAPAPAVPATALAIGVNLVGMQTAEVGLRFGSGTVPNIHFTVPRQADVGWTAANGFTKNRLPIQWELLQPMLHDTVANAAARTAIGEPGAFHAGYESYITGVLDAHASAGIKCIIDLHNYGRYRDFKFQSNGSVIGLVDPVNPLVHAYTSDNTQILERIVALAPGVTLRQSHLNDFWTRAAIKWKDHPGFGGYGLMNEPFDLPAPGQIERSFGGSEDLHIWAAYAQAAINAIRVVDAANPIYLGGNEWSAAMSLATKNPDWPLTGTNLIYEVHMYLDAGSTGQRFDFDTEVARGYNAGFGSGSISLHTGVDRLKLAVDWAQPRGIKLALTETGMPLDDPRWEEMFRRLVNYARQNGLEFYSWNGGAHWTLHNNAINHVPGWHQNKTLEPTMSGIMKASASIAQAALFDDGPGWAGSAPTTIAVYARGNLASAVTMTVSSSNGGTLSKTQLTIPAGANGQDTFTFTPPANSVATLTYTASGGLAPPPPRKIYSLADPAAYAATSLQDAAMAIIAKYSACKWELADGYTDYMQGTPAAAGQPVRAISDSGYGSSVGNAMEMVNWINDSSSMGSMTVPVMRVTNGRKSSDHSGANATALWCRKSVPVAELQPNPRNRVPYDIQDPHFSIAVVSVPGAGNSGVVFQASNAGAMYASELLFSNSRPRAKCMDHAGNTVDLTSPTALSANSPAIVTFTSAPGAQRLRVNSVLVGSGSGTFAASPLDQLLIGGGFQDYFPRPGFGGNVYAVVTGKGAPTVAELLVLERYLGTTAGIA
ncbi:cellulase family glycosylhydrolase [Caenimonas soli]|uniref:cellulase family glycosylhydrolase n=1 Tax=Caenimonas soli TaxID=2735555 RepID=UPI001556AEA4|nr:cellulase family glycosylhydrolase [Caenimonas soli]NPC58151.1 cellulase family glycosylhydrolase [Caenimonas soli]